MVKNKKRERNQKPQPFLADNDSVASTKKRSKAPKHHQKQDKMISSGISSKILKEALLQQKEVEEEVFGGNVAKEFGSVEEQPNKHEEEEDIDNFGGFSETQSQFGNYEDEIDEEDVKLLDAFLSKDAETRPMPKLDDSLIDLYKGVGKFLNKYTDGKMPKAFKHIPSMQLWEHILYLTEPENWSPNAMYEATRIFASNLGTKKAERFYRLVLLPRVRDDIQKNKRLHFALYKSLKKAVYKPAAFNKGILFPLCKSGTCNLREAVIIGSIHQKVKFHRNHSRLPSVQSMLLDIAMDLVVAKDYGKLAAFCVALLKLAEMEYCGTTSYFIKLLFEKKYGLPYNVVDAVVAHFMRFLEETRVMPVIWHQSLLAFVQRVSFCLSLTLILPSPVSVINKTIEEDRFDIPDVPMEED
ncbi:Bystin [Corchorus olitorius]|uniref:Bystin n=1 Tax=Corchorus olitorius TaxID=93759 RepID=A0A1R3IKV3_9ROSI|nr:Bystin [Corchorus olitorius]